MTRLVAVAGNSCLTMSLLFTAKFSFARQFKNHIELFSTFLDESCLSQM